MTKPLIALPCTAQELENALHADRAVRLMDAKRRDPEKPKRKYDAKKRAPKLKRVEADA